MQSNLANCTKTPLSNIRGSTLKMPWSTRWHLYHTTECQTVSSLQNYTATVIKRIQTIFLQETHH